MARNLWEAEVIEKARAVLASGARGADTLLAYAILAEAAAEGMIGVAKTAAAARAEAAWAAVDAAVA